jgi:nitroreductase/NAD-dependent dihydropyrimidine dehydrogenase PreA subunit
MVHDRVFIDAEMCVGCGLCVSVCARKLIVMEKGKAFVAEPERCSACGHCKSVCPENAPRIPRYGPDAFDEAPARGELPSPRQLLLFLRNRRSIRLFTGRTVERKTALSIIDAGRCAPTAQNRQALCYAVVLGRQNVEALRSLAISVLLEQADILERALDEEKRNPGILSAEERRFKDYPPAWRFMAELRKKGIDPLFHDAPAVIVCHVDPLGSLHPEVEAGMAMMQMALMTESMGLGSCFCALLDYAVGHSPELKEYLGIPSGHISPVSFMLGYPAVRYKRLPARNPAAINWL